MFLTEEVANSIRVLDLAAGRVETLAGSPTQLGAENGVGASARFNGPASVTLHDGLVYVADTEHHLLRVLDLRWSTTVLARVRSRRHTSRGRPINRDTSRV